MVGIAGRNGQFRTQFDKRRYIGIILEINLAIYINKYIFFITALESLSLNYFNNVKQ